jgi:hypothetical protein
MTKPRNRSNSRKRNNISTGVQEGDEGKSTEVCECRDKLTIRLRNKQSKYACASPDDVKTSIEIPSPDAVQNNGSRQMGCRKIIVRTVEQFSMSNIQSQIEYHKETVRVM